MREKEDVKIFNNGRKNKARNLVLKESKVVFFVSDHFCKRDFQFKIFKEEFPFFSLKNNDKVVREYRSKNVKIKIEPSSNGLATVFDKDIWIYSILKLKRLINRSKNFVSRVSFTPNSFFLKMNKNSGGKNYFLLRKSLSRLNGTIVRIEILNLNGNKVINEFSFIGDWLISNRRDNRVDYDTVRISIPFWVIEQFRLNNVIGSLDREYFRIRKATSRRLYEIAEILCKKRSSFSMGLKSLYLRSGSIGLLRMFRHSIKLLSKKNNLPKYFIDFDVERDLVFFMRR